MIWASAIGGFLFGVLATLVFVGIGLIDESRKRWWRREPCARCGLVPERKRGYVE